MSKKTDQDKWIIDVRKALTAKFPEITVGEIVAIFRCNSDQMDILFKAYHLRLTPAAALDNMLKAYPITT